MADATATGTMDATSSSGSVESTSIVPTSSDSVIKDSLTSSAVGQTSLQTSSDVPLTDSTQFPMQHATQMLPGNQVPMATTDPVSFTSDEVQGQTLQSQLQSGNIQSSQSLLPSSSTVNDISASDTLNSVQDTQSVIPTKSSDSQSVSTDVTKSSTVSDKTVSSVLADDETKNSNGDKSVLGVTKTLAGSVKPTDSVLPPVTSADTVDILPSSSESSTVMTGAVYSTNTPTTFSSAAQSLDTMSLKTTEAVPFPPTGKPMVPEASADSTILGGGLSDNIIYIGVPLCGLGILILLILCIICIRRRKSKAKGSPAKNRVQDLWVNNARQDIPLTSPSSVPEQNGGEAVLPDDIGCTTYEAVFDYKGELSTHLQLKQGDLVRVHRKEAAGWWRGTVGDQTGWFPSNYVQAAPPGKILLLYHFI
ncbi:E3 ubiquitin-protein ligase SH3RF1-like isoform X2 [Mercenaria mercenaria]|uniref:E3 ubiquitin-protein ligase SH3RF1-like isoform X2 n=1 Tax=Mercenaria mercenaria TaxID=6596 RepID=UPI00234E433F|nr:E3 ubiquitin-protein ligase SH3RF1-like isoform X2 [Mercenaria mercenaria]